MNKRKLLAAISASIIAIMSTQNFALAATKAQYDYHLANSGQTYFHITSTANTKTISGDPWTLYVSSINTGSSPYGIRFLPKSSSGYYNNASGVWRKTGQTAAVTGRVYTYYAAGDGVLDTKYLGARIDDDYYPASPGFTSSGWWNADRVVG